jgi:hypothetical protein
MTWLFPEPSLGPGEAIEGKTKAQLMPERGRQTTGVLYLTNHRVVFVPGRGTPRDRAFDTVLPRQQCVDVSPEAGRWGYGPGRGGFQKMRITLDDGHSALFAVRQRDVAVRWLRRALGYAPSLN